MKTIAELKRRRDGLNEEIARREAEHESYKHAKKIADRILAGRVEDEIRLQRIQDETLAEIRASYEAVLAKRENEVRVRQAEALKTIPVHNTSNTLLETLSGLRRAILNKHLTPVRFEMTAKLFRRLHREGHYWDSNFDPDLLLTDEEFADKWTSDTTIFGLPVSISLTGCPRIVSE